MENYLKEINAVLGVVGSFVCLSDGTLSASALPDKFDAASAELAARIATQTLNALETSGQRVAEADLVYGQGRLLLKNLRGGVLVIVCARSINIPLLNLTANVVAKKLAAELKPKPAAVEPAPKVVTPAPAPTEPASAPQIQAAQPAPSAVEPSPLFTELNQEMLELIDLAQNGNVRLCAINPIAVWERCPRHRALISAPQKRQIEFLCQSAQSALVIRLFERRGYEANQRFNAFHGSRHLNFANKSRDLTADVYLDGYEMYHHLDLKSVSADNERVLPVTPLLLLHLQYVEMIDPILRDLCVLLLEHDLSVGTEADKIDASQITRLCADDWGWHKTVTTNLARLEQFAPGIIAPAGQAIVLERAKRIKNTIETAPKSLRWQTRARIGESVRWYETPITGSAPARPDLAMG